MRALLVVLWIFAAGVQAAPEIPTELAPWKDWVLKDLEYRRCPLTSNSRAENAADFICTWPGTLKLKADQQGGQFSQTWQLDADGWVPLPGDSQHWPQNVRVDGNPATVTDRNGPVLWLTAGSHRVTADMHWSQRPQNLRVPELIKLIELHIDDVPIPVVQRRGDLLVLGRPADAEHEADSIDLEVFRKFKDGVPGLLTSELRLVVSGQAREEVFGPALPDGFEALTLESDEWPARLDGDGLLHVQVEPGYNEIELTARALKPMDHITVRVPDAWASQELWSYETDTSIRNTQANSKVQIDPKQADVPWDDLPTWAMSDGDVLIIEEHSRGADPNRGNQLRLAREAWLDFSGKHWFMRDRITGKMRSGWRLDTVPPYSLQRASEYGPQGDPAALLVTANNNTAARGVEWRLPAVDLWAGLRVEGHRGALPISGWQQTFDHGVSTRLHLPYGYHLIATPGADRDNGSWLSQWTLLDIFFAAVLFLLAGRLLGRTAAAITAIYLLLGFQEAGAPLWWLALVLALALIARTLPAGKLSGVVHRARQLSVLVLILLAIPFSIVQLRNAVYPQLENTSLAGARHNFGHSDPEFDVRVAAISPPPPPSAPMSMPAPPKPAPAGTARDESTLDRVVITGSRIRKKDTISRYSESTMIQTGAGEPGWDIGSQHLLHWSGPILADQTMHLIIAPPWLVRPLRVLLVGMLGWLIWQLLRVPAPRRQKDPMTASTLSLLGVCALLASPTLLAQNHPSPNLLNELRDRLTEAPRCAPHCASIADARVLASGDDIHLLLEVHAADRVAVPLPEEDGELVFRSLNVNGRTHDALTRHNRHTWVALERGVHHLDLHYVAQADRVAVAFPLPPHRTRLDTSDWQSSSLGDSTLLSDTLTLSRQRQAATSGEMSREQQFSPYVRVVRELRIDLLWGVATRVVRMSPEEGGFTVPVPLLPGEHVHSAGMQTRDGGVMAALSGHESSTQWTSSLDPVDTLKLTAPELGERAEEWRVLVSPTWHVAFDGVPESNAESDPDDMHEFVFHPLPGETLTLTISRPTPADGPTRAIDSLQLRSEFGKRASTHELDFRLRASQGGEQTIHLPEGMTLQDVRRDGRSISVHLQEGKLSLPVNPGEHDYKLLLQEAAGIGLIARTPDISVGLPAANIELIAEPPANRWLLAASGPAVGPAILFWAELVMIIALAWALSRWNHSLRLHQWLLLGIGFSTFSWQALAIVVAWLLALDWRKRHPPSNKWLFNLTQIGLVFLTLAALGSMLFGIRSGLLGSPDMMISGNHSHATYLKWFADYGADTLPRATVVSLPLWIYNLVMLAWALWLAFATVGWLRKGFAAWTSGKYWIPLIQRRNKQAKES